MARVRVADAVGCGFGGVLGFGFRVRVGLGVALAVVVAFADVVAAWVAAELEALAVPLTAAVVLVGPG